MVLGILLACSPFFDETGEEDDAGDGEVESYPRLEMNRLPIREIPGRSNDIGDRCCL